MGFVKHGGFGAGNLTDPIETAIMVLTKESDVPVEFDQQDFFEKCYYLVNEAVDGRSIEEEKSTFRLDNGVVGSDGAGVGR